jgi:Zn-dependent protease
MADFSPTIGRIDNIPIELHWTFLLLLLFILFLSLYFFVLWILLFVCVLVHELVHSINAKRNNIKVSKIVLYPFGGGSIINFEKVSPEVEFRISVVGPIASLLLAVVFGIINIFTPAGIVGSTLQILFILNIFLGVFNLLPWLPLDGGRALRSYLQKTRSYLDATKIAVKSSNIVTVLFVAGTVVYAFFLHGYSTFYREFIILWDVAIAFIIYGGAQQELQNAFMKENIADLKVEDAMTDNYAVVKSTASPADLYQTIIKSKTNIILIKKDDEVHMLSNSSLNRNLKNKDATKIGDFGVPIPSVPYNLKLSSAIDRMRSSASGIAAVTKGNSIVGVLLSQHMDSIIALHISQKNQSSKNN